MLEIKPFVKCYICYNIQSCLVTQACAQNAGNEPTPHFQPRIMWSSYTIVCPPLCVLLLSPTRPCFSISSIHHRNIVIAIPSQYRHGDTTVISVISNICDIRDTRPPSRYRQPTVISVISNIRDIQYL